MEVLYVALVVIGLVIAFKLGGDSGREEILKSQSSAMEIALSDDKGKFFESTGLHGMYSIPGHENRWPPNWVVVNHTDLLARLNKTHKATSEPEVEENSEESELTLSANIRSSSDDVLVLPSPELEKITGSGPFPRELALARVWSYIKEHDLHDSAKPTVINCDDALLAVVGQKQVTMFVLTKRVNLHLSSGAA